MFQQGLQAEQRSRSLAGQDSGPVNKYFAIIPHIDDDDLTVNEYRLIGHYRKLFGLNLPPETNAQTAAVTGMKVKDVRAARKGLVDKGRITINELTGVVVLVSLVDVMEENVRRYTNNPFQIRQGYLKATKKDTPSKYDRGGMPNTTGVTPKEVSISAEIEPPKEIEEINTLHATARSASHKVGEKENPSSIKTDTKSTVILKETVAHPVAPVGYRLMCSTADRYHVHLVAHNRKRPACKPSKWVWPIDYDKLPGAPREVCPDCLKAIETGKPKEPAPAAPNIAKVLNDAVAVNVQHIDVALADNFTGVLAQVVAGVWRQKLGRKLTADDYAAIARSLEPNNDKGFIKYYAKECEGCSVPNDKTRLRNWYAKFVTSLSSSPNGTAKPGGPDPHCPHCKGRGVTFERDDDGNEKAIYCECRGAK